MGRAELERYRAEMKQKGVDILIRPETRQGGCKLSQTPKSSTSTSDQIIMEHD